MKTLLIGSNGQVGFELQRSLKGEVIALNSQQLDLADTAAIRRTVSATKPNLIVNAAAYTAVDKAESEPELTFAINATAPQVLAEEAHKLNALLVHYSTDYVFDGSKVGAYVETDPTNPQSVYGKSKLAGEQAIQAVGGHHLIFRTSWVYGTRGKNFLLTILRLAQERDHLRVVADQIGAPTWCRSIAEATASAVSKWDAEKSGLYHLSCGGQTSWHGFAQAILQKYPKPLKATADDVETIATEQYPLPAKRPANSVLDNGKLQSVFYVGLPDWQQALLMTLDELA
ncbi:MAG: dTDP-4-dehydrorhamnose reductase [Methylophilaceae bacterium]